MRGAADQPDPLDVRATHQTKGATLADLYDPVAMPPDLVKAHTALDRAVDLCYRPQCGWLRTCSANINASSRGVGSVKIFG